MYEITREYIRDEDISIDNIKKKLDMLSQSIKLNNKMNLTDINIICEEIFGRILNKIYDINLVSSSVAVSENYIAVDLVDFDKRIAFQVTSRSDRRKITDTVKKFNESDLPSKIDSLNILILNSKNTDRYQQPHIIPLINGMKFSFKKNIFDNQRLVDLIEKRSLKEKNFILKIYEDINMLFDTGRVGYPCIIKKTELLTSNEMYDTIDMVSWKRGYGDIQLTAFIPLSYDKKVSCLMEIRKHDLAGMYMTFDEETLKEDYFLEESEFIKRHNVGRKIYEDILCMQIENVRFFLDAHAAYHIFQLFSELHQQYINAQCKIKETLGVSNMVKVNDMYLLKSISEFQWIEILYFARHHDCCNDKGNVEWNIFRNNRMNDRFYLSPNVHSNIRAEIFAELIVKDSHTQRGMLDLFWRPGYKYDKHKMEGFDNIVKWKADYTLDWVDNELIPCAHLFYKKNN